MDILMWFRAGVCDAENTCDGVNEIDFGNLLEAGRDIALRRVGDGDLTADCVESYAVAWARGYDTVYRRCRADHLRELVCAAAQ